MGAHDGNAVPDGHRDLDAVPLSRREEIFVAAADIFATKGYHATAMNDVADAMGIRKASLYHHVESKETLLYEMSLSSMQHILDAAMSATSSDPETYLREIITRHVTALLGERSKHTAALVELRSLSADHRQHIIDLRDRYDRLIDEAIRSIQTTTPRWPGIATRTVRLAMLGMLNWTVFWFSASGPETPTDLARDFADIFIPKSPA